MGAEEKGVGWGGGGGGKKGGGTFLIVGHPLLVWGFFGALFPIRNLI